MAKKEKFLTSFKKYLEKEKIQNKKEILLKYERLIELKLKNGEKITKIIEELGSFENIVKKETKKSISFINMIKKFLNTIKSNCIKIVNKVKNLNSNIDVLEKKELKEIDNKKKEIKNLKGWKKILYTAFRVFLYIAIIASAIAIMWLTTIFVASLFMLLDGVKFIGVSFLLFALIILLCWVIIILNKVVSYRKLSFRKNLYAFIVLLIFIGLNVGIILIQYFKFDYVSNVTEKYTISTMEKIFNLPKGEGSKYYINFNSWYKTKYIIHYDETLNNQFKLKVEYYECFYDTYFTHKSNSLYISLKRDTRDLISMYIENLKENKIYDNKELSRNVVNIYINEKDYEKLVFVD